MELLGDTQREKFALTHTHTHSLTRRLTWHMQKRQVWQRGHGAVDAANTAEILIKARLENPF